MHPHYSPLPIAVFTAPVVTSVLYILFRTALVVHDRTRIMAAIIITTPAAIYQILLLYR